MRVLPLRRRLHLSLATVILVFGLASSAWSKISAGQVTQGLDALTRASGAPLRVTKSPSTGVANFVAADRSHPMRFAVGVGAKPEQVALALLGSAGAAFGIEGTHQVAVRSVSGPDEVGMHHVRLQQVQRGVPVVGAEVIVHLAGTGVLSVTAKTVPDATALDTTPTIAAADSLAAARALVARSRGVADPRLSDPRLEILDPSLLGGASSEARLAWFVEATSFALREQIWVDAKSGGILLHFNAIAEARNRQIYDAGGFDTLPGTLVRSEGEPAIGNADADAAYDYSGDTYDYYFSEHGRDSFDDAGAALISTVHFCPGGFCPFFNAFWDGTQMVYGDGFSLADDVDAHELTHAVTEYSAGLIYAFQSGALNESFSDIFGEIVDLTNGSGTDTPEVRWLLGEDVPGFGAIRDMANPNDFGNPGKVSDPFYDCFGQEVHNTSGVPNHAFALLVDGGSFNGFTVDGIGLTKAGKIEYRTLTQYLAPASTFLDAYLALQQSCTDLIGVAGITAADCEDLVAALDAVEMSEPVCLPPVCGDGKTRGAEQCDDGNKTDGDACDSNCTFPACGNGVRSGAEECDDGNPFAGDGCEGDCTESPGCSTVLSATGPLPIPDLASVSSSLTFSGAGGVTSVRVVQLAGTHTYVGDLEVHLTSPAGTDVRILDRVCGPDDDFQLGLADNAPSYIPCPPTDHAAHQPSLPMYGFLGEDPVGPWTLSVFDRFTADVGTLNEWALQICTECVDSDFDGDCDAQDPCNNLASQDFVSPPRSRLQLSRVNADPAPDNDTISLTGVFDLPTGKTFADLRPDLQGARLVIDAQPGVSEPRRRVDVRLASGLFLGSGSRGWRLSPSGKVWSFSDKTAAPAGGITQMRIQDRGASSPRRVKVTVGGKHGSYGILSGDEPLEVAVTLGGSTEALQGLCGESAFSAGDCAFNQAGTTVSCQR